MMTLRKNKAPERIRLQRRSCNGSILRAGSLSLWREFRNTSRFGTLVLAFGIALTIEGGVQGDEPAELLLRDVPPGVTVESSMEIPSAQTKAIGQKLGGEILRLTNSVIRVHGRSIQVNVLTAVDEPNASAIHDALAKIKPYPACQRKGSVVIEFVGKDIEAALALKTSYELGLLAKPDTVRYRVTAQLATSEKVDYMACNTLFNQFLALQSGDSVNAIQQINELAKRFTFGSTLVLSNPSLDGASAKRSFDPPATGSKASDATTVYSFGELETRQNVPFVTATIEVTVDKSGLRKAIARPSEQLTASTAFWPADDPAIVALAAQITAGKTTNGAKAMAILEWLSPGQNLKYSGQTGSRWGTRKVFEQKFGHCWDFSDCFITLARAAGVPSRQVAGWFYGSSGHVWAEFYREDQGWQQVDPTGGGKLLCGIYHIPYFTSEDGEMPIVYVAMPKIETLELK